LTPVLLLGEPGTGKGVMAQYIHSHSPRRAGPFQRLDCTAVAGAGVLSALFGHVRGAYTGATCDRTGVLRAADGGSCCVDEIGDLAKQHQGKLLTVIQDGEIIPMGADTAIHINVRFIAATNVDLEQAVARGHFRRDVLDRLGGHLIQMPPLRDRAEDFEGLATQAWLRMAGPNARIDARALDVLAARPWPGNIRQLVLTLQRVHAVCPAAVLNVAGLQAAEVDGGSSWPHGETYRTLMARAELQILRRALAATSNRTQAAKLLGMSRSTFLDRLKRSAGGGGNRGAVTRGCRNLDTPLSASHRRSQRSLEMGCRDLDAP